MNTNIETLLQALGPCLSSQVVERLSKSGLSAQAARKRISRATGNVCRLNGIRFPNREAFLFLDKQFGKPEFYERLASALKETGSSYGRALIGLAARDGTVPEKQFPVATGLPVERAKGQVPHLFVEQKLIGLGLITRDLSPDGDVILA